MPYSDIELLNTSGSKSKPSTKASAAIQHIHKYLLDKNIPHSFEIRFVTCRDKLPLPFDIMIIINGTTAILEFDGEQHFNITSKYNDTAEKLLLCQHHDLIKTKYAIDNRIPLLRISYKDVNFIPNMLDRFINHLSYYIKESIYLVLSSAKLYQIHIDLMCKLKMKYVIYLDYMLIDEISGITNNFSKISLNSTGSDSQSNYTKRDNVKTNNIVTHTQMQLYKIKKLSVVNSVNSINTVKKSQNISYKKSKLSSFKKHKNYIWDSCNVM